MSIMISNYVDSEVIAVMILDTLHQALITHTGMCISLIPKRLNSVDMAIVVYTYTVTDWGNADQVQFVVW
jgi:hypothetical protein